MSGFIATPLGAGIARIGQEDPLRDALLDSRQRWRDIAAISCDLVFETDAEGRFVFLAPDPVLGWRAAMLLGEPAHGLLVDRNDTAFNPFAPTTLQRRRRAWLHRQDGSKACIAFAAAPLTDGEGRIVGARGAGIDVTEQDAYDAAVAAQLRRSEVVDHILWQMRQEVLAPRMMQAVARGAGPGARGRWRGAAGHARGRGRRDAPPPERGRDRRRAGPRARPPLRRKPRPGQPHRRERAAGARLPELHALRRAHRARALARRRRPRLDRRGPPARFLRHRHHPHGAGARGDPARDGAPGPHRSAHRPAQPPRLPRRDEPPDRPAGPRNPCRAR